MPDPAVEDAGDNDKDLVRSRFDRIRSALSELVLHPSWAVAEASSITVAVCKSAAQAMEVAIASYWRFDPGLAQIRSQVRYPDASPRPPLALSALQYPEYFAALHLNLPIAADDAVTDPRTACLSPDYLTARGIGAMLDTPVFLKGKLEGVLCLEHIGGTRDWSAEEICFAMAFANLISLALEQRERLSSDRRAEASAALLRVAFEAMPSLISVTDTQGMVRMANRAFEAALGLDPDTATGRCAADFPFQSVAIARTDSDALSPPVAEERLLRSGCEHWYHTTHTELEAAGCEGWLLTVRSDVTAQHLAAEELKRLNGALSSFAYSVSHDLRAPLRAIDGFSRILTEDYGSALAAEGRRMLDQIMAGTQRMNVMIEGLLALFQISRGDDTLLRLQVDISALAREVWDELSMARDGAAPELVVSPGLHATGDPRLLRNLLQNLLQNARKFSAGRQDARVHLAQDTSGAWTVDGGGAAACFIVRDNGVGFDLRNADKLFGAFVRLHADRRYEGVGIGLAVAQRIVQRHGGQIWAESTPGQGAAFYFTLPA